MAFCTRTAASRLLLISLFWAQAASQNTAPTYVPSYVAQLPLTPTPDALHYTVRVTIAPFADPRAAAGTRAAKTLNLVADTASAELFAFAAGFCARPERASASTCLQATATALASSSRRSLSRAFDSETVYEPEPGASVYSAYISLPLSASDSAGDAAITSCTADSASGAPVFDSLTTVPGAQGASCALSEVLLGVNTQLVSASPSAFSMQRWRFEDGLLGLGYNALARSGASPWLQLLQRFELDTGAPAQYTPFVSLDLRPAGEASRLLLGGVDDAWRGALQWSAAAAVPNQHSFALHSMRVCGADLLSNFSAVTPFTAVIDTGSSGLQLPAELFDAIVSWLPVVCTSGANRRACALPASAARHLPDLEFTFASNAPPLLLALSNLLLPAAYTAGFDAVAGPGAQRLLLTRGAQLINNDAFPSLRTIVFGVNALKDFGVVLAMASKQVGLAQRTQRAASAFQCNAPVQCTGQQDAYPASRVCVDPDCSVYRFYELDSVAKECRLNVGAQIAVLLVAITVALVESVLLRRQLKLEQNVDALAVEQQEAIEGGGGGDEFAHQHRFDDDDDDDEEDNDDARNHSD